MAVRDVASASSGMCPFRLDVTAERKVFSVLTPIISKSARRGSWLRMELTITCIFFDIILVDVAAIASL